MKTQTLTIGLESSFNVEELLLLLKKHLTIFFNLSKEEEEVLKKNHVFILDNLKIAITGVDNKYFFKNGNAYFSPLHSGQYLIYLYLFSHFCYKHLNNIELSEKLYYLNKILHSCDIYPAVELPKVFFLEHPLGTVLGRALYGNNFFAMQGCTVGGNKKLEYPIIGNNVKMYSNSKIIGNSKIGDNVQIGANAYIKDTNIPDNVTVFGQFPNLILKDIKL